MALAAAPMLRLLLAPLRKKEVADAPLLVFASYMVGDLFMALPALKRLAASRKIRILCRPDCVELLRREGLHPVPFDNAFITGRNPAAFLRTLRAAWRLRGLPKAVALDLDADPRTALWLRIAGAPRTVSFRRPFAVLFDETFALPPDAIHQADRDMAVAEEFLRRRNSVDGGGWKVEGGETQAPLNDFSHHADTPENTAGIEVVSDLGLPQDYNPPSTVHPPPSRSPWLLSVWTRKAAKNWPLEHWDELMEQLLREGVPFAVLHAPDGGSEYQLFRARWSNRVAFIAGPLEEIVDHVRSAAGVIATDNFLGHMAGYYGKPVLWINIASPAAQVAPRGPRTVAFEATDPRRPASLAIATVARTFKALRESRAGLQAAES
jgi:ADP-heptose:LPS heptosyltransferase